MLYLGTLDDGLLLDDVAIYGGLRVARAGHPGAHWWDLYYLGGFDERLRFSGRLPWWVAQGAQLHFFRPAAAASHYVDVLLWPDQVPLMHLQNLVWFAATGGAVAWLYRDALSSPTEVLVALAVFLLAYTHEWPVQWLAARNTAMATFFGVVSIASFRRWNHAWWCRVLALAGLGLSLLSSELGVSAVAFSASFEFMRSGEEKKGRWWRLGTTFGLVAAWRVAYILGGFGARGSGTYIDPGSAPFAFLEVAPERLLVELLALLGPPELLVDPAVPAAYRTVLWALVVATVVLVLFKARGNDLLPWSVGAAICLVLLVASVPQPRLLGFVVLGWAPLVARALAQAWSLGGRWRVLVPLAGVHQLVLGPLVVTGAFDSLRPTELVGLGAPGRGLGDLGGRNLFLLNPPTYASAKMVEAVRDSEGLSMPAFVWSLAIGDHIDVTRSGCCTVVLRSEDGMFRERWAAMYRGPQVPFSEGDIVMTLGFTATVRKVSSGGRPMEVAFEMSGPLRSRQYVFAWWNGRDYEVVAASDIPPER